MKCGNYTMTYYIYNYVTILILTCTLQSCSEHTCVTYVRTAEYYIYNYIYNAMGELTWNCVQLIYIDVICIDDWCCWLASFSDVCCDLEGSWEQGGSVGMHGSSMSVQQGRVLPWIQNGRHASWQPKQCKGSWQTLELAVLQLHREGQTKAKSICY